MDHEKLVNDWLLSRWWLICNYYQKLLFIKIVLIHGGFKIVVAAIDDWTFGRCWVVVKCWIMLECWRMLIVIVIGFWSGLVAFWKSLSSGELRKLNRVEKEYWLNGFEIEFHMLLWNNDISNWIINLIYPGIKLYFNDIWYWTISIRICY